MYFLVKSQSFVRAFLSKYDPAKLSLFFVDELN